LQAVKVFRLARLVLFYNIWSCLFMWDSWGVQNTSDKFWICKACSYFKFNMYYLLSCSWNLLTQAVCRCPVFLLTKSIKENFNFWTNLIYIHEVYPGVTLIQMRYVHDLILYVYVKSKGSMVTMVVASLHCNCSAKHFTQYIAIAGAKHFTPMQ
jgi:hypothetical protein